MKKFLILALMMYSSVSYPQTKLNVLKAKHFGPLCIPALTYDINTSINGYCFGLAEASLLGAYSMMSALLVTDENQFNDKKRNCLRSAYEKISPNWPETLPVRFINSPDSYGEEFSSAVAFKLSVKEIDIFCSEKN